MGSVELAVVSMARGATGRTLRGFEIGDVPILALNHGEPIEVHVRNTGDDLMGVRVIIDGINMSTGHKATDNPNDPMFTLRPQGLERISAWPEGYRDGEKLVFQEDATDPVKLFEVGNFTAANSICVMTFTEGRPETARKRDVVAAGTRKGSGSGRTRRGARRSATRLVKPVYGELIQLGFAWADSVQKHVESTDNGRRRDGGGKPRFDRFVS